jgi:hypothetical protein
VLAEGVPLIDTVLDQQNQARPELDNRVMSWDPH